MKGSIKKARYTAEAALLYTAYHIFKTIGLDRASAIGGWIGRNIGPRLAASRKALANISLAFPEKSKTEHEEILKDMWDNLGRVIAEYPHLRQIVEKRVKIEGCEHIKNISPNAAAIIFGGHLANWEISPALHVQKSFTANLVYREPNNKFVAGLLDKCRSFGGELKTIPKSKTGVRNMIKDLQNGEKLGILIDQKYNAGIPAKFFGREAMTSPAFAQLSKKFGCPLIPVQSQRTSGANFRLIIHKPLETKDKSDKQIIDEAHSLLENWIVQAPGQWLWLHRRWPNSAGESR